MGAQLFSQDMPKGNPVSAFGRFVAFSCGLLFLAVGVAPVPKAANLTVTNTNDSGCSTLRNALAAANPNDTILFAVGNNQTITLAPMGRNNVGVVSNGG
jgi:hypothetical protein